ncbi:hypothetical protein DXT63_08430 [Thermoanaerobacteraceae bacterium SP2]|nr:hypothetical protein DXT63_08430 [Thermoanaerobacteraceae bacterium SP2]
MGYTWNQLSQNTWDSLGLYTWDMLANALETLIDTKQSLTMDFTGNIDTKIVLTVEKIIFADTKQVITLDRETLADSKQIIYASREKLTDTKFILSADKIYLIDSKQILYLPKEIIIDSLQLTAMLSQMVFTGELGPGQTLVIDTEKFIALVNDILANNSVDKFVELETGVNYLVIQDDTGNVLMTIQIQYKDRWL